MQPRMFDRAYSKTLYYDEDFSAGPIFHQDFQEIFDRKLPHEPDFLYTIDYEFSCDVDVWGRVATKEYSIGSVLVTCADLAIINRPHPFEAIVQEDIRAAEKFGRMVEREIERKYERGVHID